MLKKRLKTRKPAETRKGNDFSCIPAGNGLQFIQLTEKAGLK